MNGYPCRNGYAMETIAREEFRLLMERLRLYAALLNHGRG